MDRTRRDSMDIVKEELNLGKTNLSEGIVGIDFIVGVVYEVNITKQRFLE